MVDNRWELFILTLLSDVHNDGDKNNPRDSYSLIDRQRLTLISEKKELIDHRREKRIFEFVQMAANAINNGYHGSIINFAFS